MTNFFGKTKKENKEVVKGTMGETPFKLILNSEILTENDLEVLEPLKQEIKETFIKSQVFRTRTEMEISVLNEIKHPTPESKFWQATREQNVMFTELVMLSYEYRKNAVKAKIIQRDINSEKDDLKKELLEIELEKKLFSLKIQEKTAKDRIREVKAWSEIKEREAKKMSKEALADVDNHQLISYTIRWIKQSIAMGNTGSPSERQNLLGQLRSGVLGCIQNKVLHKVLENFSEEVKARIKKDYGIQDSKT